MHIVSAMRLAAAAFASIASAACAGHFVWLALEACAKGNYGNAFYAGLFVPLLVGVFWKITEAGLEIVRDWERSL